MPASGEARPPLKVSVRDLRISVRAPLKGSIRVPIRDL